MSSIMGIEFSEDESFFENLFDGFGGLEENVQFFDFREPDLKRAEFSKVRNSVFKKLISEYGNSCQLQCHEDCEGIGTQVDHLIPLSSNVLNKELRLIKGKNGKTTPTQSFGSNDSSNFVLACRRCNAFKKHRMPEKDLLSRVRKIRGSL